MQRCAVDGTVVLTVATRLPGLMPSWHILCMHTPFECPFVALPARFNAWPFRPARTTT